MKKITKIVKGTLAEKKACRFLKKLGHKIISRNFSCNSGEIDIITFDKESNELVFVEVRYREQGIDSALESVNYGKRKRIIRASRHFLMLNEKFAECFIRYDIIAVTKNDHNRLLIKHFPDAFRNF